MRRDKHYLEDIRIAAEEIAEFIAGMQVGQFLSDSKTRSAVERQLITIGEAANKVSPEYRAQQTSIPWKRLIQLRNFYVHGYDRLRPEEVWTTATRLVPRISRLVTRLIDAEEEHE